MRPRSKPAFASYKVNKISGGDLLLEKPIFVCKGKSLAVSSKETCHLYSTSTGEHVKELFAGDSSIINMQLSRSDQNILHAATQRGSIVTYCFDTENETSLKLKLSPGPLKKLKLPVFNVNTRHCSWGDNTPDVDWENTLARGVQFLHVVIAKDIIYASWRVNNEFFAHLSAFNKAGDLKKRPVIPSEVGLMNTARNFIVGETILICMSVDFIFVQNLENVSIRRKHMIGQNAEASCIALSQDNSFFATGDSSGRILIWRNFFEKTPIKDIFHWHQLPVRALAFSDLGTNMFSGGEENVLVKWSLSSRQKTFLPRLPSSLLHVTISEDNDSLAISTADSRILIINMSLTCLTVIQHFSRWSSVGLSYQGGILMYEPRTDALVLPGRTGHIQFLSRSNRGRFLYTFDVTNRNFITRDQEGTIENIEVRFVRFSRCGKWLVTAESGAKDSSLKFWQYNETAQEFKLNTAVDAPHGSDGFHCLEVSSDEQAITTGPDNQFRLWTLVETTHLQQVRTYWTQMCNSSYRDLPVTVADFARDGSIAGVGFGPVLAVWDTDSCAIKCSLTPPLRRNEIKAVKFGNHEVSHLVVTGTDAEVSCWNLVTLCMQWMVPLQLGTLISDPNSLYMCAFSKKGGLFIFNPLSAFPELRLENVCESQIIAGVFITKAESICVYFVTSNQELYYVGEDEKVTSETTDASAETQFRIPIAETCTNDVEKSKSLPHILTPTKSSPAAMLDGPPHTLPPMSLLLNGVLRSLLLSVTVSSKPVTTNAEDLNVTNLGDTQLYKNSTLEESQLLTLVTRLFEEK